MKVYVVLETEKNYENDFEWHLSVKFVASSHKKATEWIDNNRKSNIYNLVSFHYIIQEKEIDA